ncbi:MAG: Gram-positive signal peptide protein family [Pedosphaera sp.]|nr:Gram-positive signal peptide protein family [Pedosphaera sp.]
MVVVLILLLIPLRIISMGYLPAGDARRHVAKAFTDRPYTEILALRSDYSMDHSPGWEWLLRFLHLHAGWGQEALVTFSVAGLMLCVFYAPLPWLRRPEAWLAALLAQMIAIPEVMVRLSQARPLLLTEGILIAILFAWSKPGQQKPSWPKIILTWLGISLSVWMHGAWYLWIVPLLAFFLAQSWRSALWLTGCVTAGIFAGAVFTGKPVEFLRQALLIIADISREHLPQWQLVGELRPSYGEFDTLALLGGVILWRWLQTRRQPEFLRDPVFCLIVLCWILGFKADRFWADWGVPAVLVWLTMQFEEILPAFYDSASVKRLALCGLVAIPLFLHTTNDLDRRYSYSLNEVFLDATDPALKGWLPDSNGIFYNAQMEFFYNTFYKNPQGDWRYVLGLEPALMHDDDLQILRQLQRYNYNLKAYEPWISKMHPADRLVVYSPIQPDLPQLEWHNAIANIWLGRQPKSAH